MASTKMIDIRRGMVLNMNGTLFYCLDRDLNTPGNWRAILYLKLKNMTTGSITDERVHPDDKVDVVYLDTKEYNYSYKDGDDYVFMDTQTYDQMTLDENVVGDAKNYLLEEQMATVAIHEDNPLYIDLPASVELEITYTEPGLQGDRSTGGTKPATLQTGLQIQVPLFLETGTKVKVDTRSGDYLGRVND